MVSRLACQGRCARAATASLITVLVAMSAAPVAAAAPAQRALLDQIGPSTVTRIIDRAIDRAAADGALPAPRESIARMAAARLAAERISERESRRPDAARAAVERTVRRVIADETLRVRLRTRELPPLPPAAPQTVIVAPSTISSGERSALTDLYTSTAGGAWFVKTNWNGAAGTECTWYGVTCDAGKTTVQAIDLHSDNLTGPLPASISNLTNLVHLDLYINNLNGSIPSSIGSLTKLQRFDVGTNQLTGSIPTQLGGLTAMTYLDLDSNQLTGAIPSGLGNLTKLDFLDLDGNQLTGSIPSQFDSLSLLQRLFLFDNQLSGSIPDLSALAAKLTMLDLHNNQLTGSIPASIGSLSNLTLLDLSTNQLTGSLPNELAGLGSATAMEPRTAPGVGLVVVDTVDVHSNQLSGGLDTLQGALTLTNLDASENQFSGGVPAGFANIHGLVLFDVHANQLSGTVGSQLSGQQNLVTVNLSGNKFTGTIPDLSNSKETITFFDSSDNPTFSPQASPTWFPDCPNLQHLGVANDNIDTAPPDLSALHSTITYFNPSNNPFTPGQMWTFLPNLTHLDTLILNNCNFTGPIENLGALRTNMAVFIISNNNFEAGQTPTFVPTMTGVTDLEMASDNLTGQIPNQFGNLVILQHLDLGHNAFSGPIPSFFDVFTELEDLNVAGNAMTGSISNNIVNLTKLAPGASDLRYNGLYSTSPSVVSFLNAAQIGGDWMSTQTVAPTGLVAGASTNTQVTVNWTPIQFISGPGGTEVFYSQTSGGPYNGGGTSSSKSTNSWTLNLLNPGTDYFVVLKTLSQPNSFNANTIVSDPSAEIELTTLGGGCTAPSITLQPQSKSIGTGQTASLSVGAAGTAPFTYQWYQGSSGTTTTPVGTNSDTLAVGPLTQTTSFWARVSNGCGHANSNTATITVGPNYNHFYWSPVVSNASGKNGAFFDSIASVVDPTTQVAHVELDFFGATLLTMTTTIQPGSQLILNNPVASLGATGSGALEFRSDQPLLIFSKTFDQIGSSATCFPGGTLGQDYPTLIPSDGFASGQTVFLVGLVENADYRSNIGVVNMGSGTGAVAVDLFNGTGSLFTTYTVTLTPGEWHQDTEPFKNIAGHSDVDSGYARIRVTAGTGIWPVGSVVSNITNGPNTVLPQVQR